MKNIFLVFLFIVQLNVLYCQENFSLEEQQPVLNKFFDELFSDKIIPISVYREYFGNNNELESFLLIAELKKMEISDYEFAPISTYIDNTPNMHISYAMIHIREVFKMFEVERPKEFKISFLEYSVDMIIYKLEVKDVFGNPLNYIVEMNLEKIDGNFITDIKSFDERKSILW